MAILRPLEIQKMSAAELQEKLSDIQKDLMKLRAQKASGVNPENPGRIRAIKKTIARMLTISWQKARRIEKKNE